MVVFQCVLFLLQIFNLLPFLFFSLILFIFVPRKGDFFIFENDIKGYFEDIQGYVCTTKPYFRCA